MAKPANFRTEKLVVPANSSAPVGAVGTFVRLRNATGTLFLTAYAADGGGILADNLQLDNGDMPRFEERFRQLTFRNATGAQITADAVIGEGEHEVSSIAGTVSVSNNAGTTYDSSADSTIANAASLDLAADLTLRERILQAAQANTGELCVRDQAGTTSEGFRLYPGGHYILGNNGAVRVRNNSGASQVLHVAENKG